MLDPGRDYAAVIPDTHMDLRSQRSITHAPFSGYTTPLDTTTSVLVLPPDWRLRTRGTFPDAFLPAAVLRPLPHYTGLLGSLHAAPRITWTLVLLLTWRTGYVTLVYGYATGYGFLPVGFV